MDYNNYKPYRTKAQKIVARKTAVKCEDGTYRSSAPVSYHKSMDARTYDKNKVADVPG